MRTVMIFIGWLIFTVMAIIAVIKNAGEITEWALIILANMYAIGLNLKKEDKS